ncbi:MAG: GNAT family N-acetyltransferase [Planctomycetota bacterium]
MVEDVVVEPMTEQFILWRCLHGGPLSRETIDRWSSATALPLERYRQRNVPLLVKLIRTYGACAILARDGDEIVGQLRFYPKAVCDLTGTGGYLCLQQDHPAGPAGDFVDSDFPALAEIEDKMLVVHCMMTGSSQQKANPYQHKGIGTRMVKALIEWARANGWERIEADAFEDLPIIYEITGSAGHTFWEKMGFVLVDRHPHPDLQQGGSEVEEFIKTLEEQAKSIGIDPARAIDRLVMRLDLT